jgi:hypothetical protein
MTKPRVPRPKKVPPLPQLIAGNAIEQTAHQLTSDPPKRKPPVMIGTTSEIDDILRKARHLAHVKGINISVLEDMLLPSADSPTLRRARKDG